MRKVLIVLVAVFGFGFVYSQTPLPKGAKLKAIKYHTTGTIAVGYVYKKQFVENQNITFFNMGRMLAHNCYISEKDGIFYYAYSDSKKPLSSLDTIASGAYFTKNGTAYIEGIVHSKFVALNNDRAVYKGVFQISNTVGGNTLTTNPNPSGGSNNHSSSLGAIKGVVQSFSTSAGKTSTTNPNTVMSNYNQSSLEKLKIYAEDIYSYQGYFNDREGTVNDSQIPVTLQKQLNDYVLKIEFNDRILETVVNSDNVRKSNLYFKFGDFIKSSQDVKLNYKNGDVFIGSVEKDYSDKYSAKKGEYKYVTGEVYTGIIDRKGLGGIQIIAHEQGKTVFADGTTANGDWTKQYNFTDSEWRQISANSKSLTEIRDKAINFNKKKDQVEKDRREIAEKNFYEKYPSAKSKSDSKSASSQNGSSAIDDLFPQVSNIKVGMSYQELKETLPLELYDKSLTTVQGKQAIFLTPNNGKIQQFLADKLKIMPEAEAKEIYPSIVAVEMALKMKGKSWANAFPKVTLLNDKVYSVSMME